MPENHKKTYMKPKLLKPSTLDNLKHLGLTARRVVEGFMAGPHPSPYHGFAAEFAEYREYLPGDDLRYFDWKALGKSDRRYIKKFQSETNLKAHLLLDVSASMGYASGLVTKLRWGAALCACLAHLLLLQHDAAGLTLFDDSIRHRLPPAQGPRQRHEFFRILESARPGRTTDLEPVLHRVAETLPHRGLVILVSDLLHDPEALERGLSRLLFRGHEVIAFQVLDPFERAFPFEGLCEFLDLETGERILVQPETAGDAVRAEMERHIEAIRGGLARLGVDHRTAVTDDAFDRYLARYLHHRSRRRRR